MRKVFYRVKTGLAETNTPILPILMVAGLLLAFGVLADFVTEGATSAFDRQIVLGLRSASDPANSIGPFWIQRVARDVTSLGSVVVLSIVVISVAGYLFLTRRNVSAWLMLASVVGGSLINNALKYAFARPRPDILLESEKLVTFSFPSGHAAMSAITYLTLAALLSRTTTSRQIKIFFAVIGGALTIVVGISRVYLGVHYPTDVLAGWCIGSAWALGCWALFAFLQREGTVEPPRAG